MTARDRTPDYLLERLAAGDLPPERAAALRAALAAEPDGEARLAALAASDRDILAHLPPPAMADAIRTRARRSRRWAVVALGPALAAAAVVIVMLMQPAARPGEPDALEPTRIKGEQPHLVVHRQRDLAIERLAAGAQVRPGDLVQVAYVAGEQRYGVIVSLDGRGGVTRHLPEIGAAAGALAGPGLTALPHAFELDDAPGFERLIFVTGDAAFAVEPVLAAVRAIAGRPDAATRPLALPPGLTQASFLMRKAD